MKIVLAQILFVQVFFYATIYAIPVSNETTLNVLNETLPIDKFLNEAIVTGNESNNTFTLTQASSTESTTLDISTDSPIPVSSESTILDTVTSPSIINDTLFTSTQTASEETSAVTEEPATVGSVPPPQLTLVAASNASENVLDVASLIGDSTTPLSTTVEDESVTVSTVTDGLVAVESTSSESTTVASVIIEPEQLITMPTNVIEVENSNLTLNETVETATVIEPIELLNETLPTWSLGSIESSTEQVTLNQTEQVNTVDEQTTISSEILIESTTSTSILNETTTNLTNVIPLEDLITLPTTTIISQLIDETTIESTSTEETTTTQETTQETVTSTPSPSQPFNLTELIASLDENLSVEVKNYSLLTSGPHEPNSYSLRIRIKGYKWNDAFRNVNSSEAQSLLRKLIVPLLYKKLGLNAGEISDVKLLSLFKGSVQSDLVMQTNSSLQPSRISKRLVVNETETESVTDEIENEHVSQYDIMVENSLKGNSSNKTKANYEMEYVVKIVGIVKNQSEKEWRVGTVLEQLVKHAVLKHFEGKLKRLDVALVSTANNSLDTMTLKNLSNLTEPIEIRMKFSSYFEMTPKDVTNALVEFAVNKRRCVLEKTDNVHLRKIECGSNLKDASSLLRLADFWIALEDSQRISASFHALSSLNEFLDDNPASIIALAVIGGILAVFFIGCIVAICCTRKPYRRAGKVYELESAAARQNVQLASSHASTKSTVMQKPKELYY